MILALIGMSGAGKSSWAGRLAGAGYTWLHCDELIAERLGAHFDVGSGSVYDLGAWMGLPFEPHYAERAAIYLAHEADVLHEIANAVARGALPPDLVIDLTGSAIYVERTLLERLRQVATVVYLAISPQLHDQMVRDYIAQPRPILWDATFQPLPHEVPLAALARCYPHLLISREQQYAQLSHITLADTLHRDPAFTVEAFLAYVEHGRPNAQVS